MLSRSRPFNSSFYDSGIVARPARIGQGSAHPLHVEAPEAIDADDVVTARGAVVSENTSRVFS